VDGETGQLVWSNNYSTLYNERSAAAACDQAGNLYLIGRAFSGSNYDIIVQKYREHDGDLAWTRHIAGEAGLDDIGWDIAVNSQGRPVVCGLIGTSAADADAVTVVLDPADGATIWRRDLPGAVYNIEVQGGWVGVADNDDIILGTRTWESATGFDLVLRRYAAADGADVWSRRWNSGGFAADDPRAMVLDQAGDALMAGVSSSKYLVIKFSAVDGAPLWHSTYTGPPNWYNTATCLTVAADGTVVASGFSDGAGTGWDVATIGLAPDTGSLRWVHRFDGENQSDEARAIAASEQGDVAVTGYCYGYTTGNDFLSLLLGLGTATAVSPDATPRLAALTGAWPNPFNPRVTLAYALPADGPLRLTIHDVRGRLVAILADGFQLAGNHAIVWRGDDRGGRPAPSGTYFAMLQHGDSRASCKLLLTR
jgi:hypothetical protein